jgi:hypothetical protein
LHVISQLQHYGIALPAGADPVEVLKQAHEEKRVCTATPSSHSSIANQPAVQDRSPKNPRNRKATYRRAHEAFRRNVRRFTSRCGQQRFRALLGRILPAPRQPQWS